MTQERAIAITSGQGFVILSKARVRELQDRAAQPPTLAEALALPDVRALVEAAILDAQLRAFEQCRLDTPDEIKAAANARIAAAQEGEG